GGQLQRALRARHRRLARCYEEQRAGDGAHLTALEHHERGRYSAPSVFPRPGRFLAASLRQ
ncbi:MAG TPA: hypothetical protein VF221_00225, partial [Chloroflexota bacterium]